MEKFCSNIESAKTVKIEKCDESESEQFTEILINIKEEPSVEFVLILPQTATSFETENDESLIDVKYNTSPTFFKIFEDKNSKSNQKKVCDRRSNSLSIVRKKYSYGPKVECSICKKFYRKDALTKHIMRFRRTCGNIEATNDSSARIAIVNSTTCKAINFIC